MKPTAHHVLEPFEGYWDADWRFRSAQVRDPGRMTMRWPHGLVRRNLTEFWRARTYYVDKIIVLPWQAAIGDWRKMPGANIYMIGDDDED